MDPNASGAGPWTFENPVLGPGDPWRIDLSRTEKGRYARFTPMDSVLVKNYDTSNRIDVEINGLYSVDVDPGGKDSYDETGVQVFQVVNAGDTEIPEGQVTVSVKADPYDADDAALEDKMRGPIGSFVKNQFGVDL